MTRLQIPAGRMPHGRAVPKMLGLLALGLGLFMTLVGASLAWNTMRANSALEQAAAQSEAQAGAVREAIASIERGLASPEVAAAVRAEQRGEADRDALVAALRDAGIRNVLYLINATAPLETTNLDALPGGGFATLNMLLEAGESGKATVQAHFAGTPDEYLALARRLDDGQEPAAVLWVALPMTVVTNQIDQPDGVDGLALRQGGAGGAVDLLTLGAGAPGQARSVPIPGTHFELAWQRRQVLGPMSTAQLGGLAGAGLLMLLLGGLLIHRSRQPVVEAEPTDDDEDRTPTSMYPETDGERSNRARSAPATSSDDSDADSPAEETAHTETGSPDGSSEESPNKSPDDDLGPLLDQLNEESNASERAPGDEAPEDERKAADAGAGDDAESTSTKAAAAEDDFDDLSSPAPEDDSGFTADGEPRRESGPTRALDAPELGSFGGGAPTDGVADDGENEDDPDGTEADVDPDVDEQAEMSEMMRALMDDGDAEAPSSTESGASPGGAPEAAPPAKAASTVIPDVTIFRAYDIRGVVGDTLDEDVAEAIGRAIGSEARDRNLSRIAVARDGRLSGAEMLAALARGLAATGLEVIEVGAVPTPVLYYAAQEIGGGSGVMVTGSHNPPDYNGFKIVLGGETLAGDAIRRLHDRLASGRLVEGEGQIGEQRISSRYIERIGNDIQLEKSLKVVVDCGNGIAGAIAPKLLESIGADVIPLYAEVDGSFPNHHPDPGDPKTLEDLRLCVRNFEAEVGIAFDGDGDRLGVVGPDGEIIYPDRLMMLFARDVLARNDGAEIIYDVKCSSLLAGDIESAGGRPVMARTGHSFIKAELKQRQAPLAGEMSGHFFFGERWYGFDDGLYAAARLLEILAADTRATGQIFADLPKAESTPELKVEMQEGQPHAFVKAFAEKASFEGATINSIDGVRADFEDGFGLVRASNTTPVLVLRFEGTSKEALNRIQGAFRDAMLAINPALKLPF